MSMLDKVVFRSVEAGAGMRGEAVDVIRGFEEAGAVLYAPLADGGAVERLGSVYRDRLAPLGYRVEYSGGSMEESGEGKRRFSVRLPVWERAGVTRPTS
ncbi:hypothetical protein ACWGLA_01015 [Streptomyces albidoflavus]